MKFLNKIPLLLASCILWMPTHAQTNKKQKIDGVVAVLGDYVILDSDVDKAMIELQANGVDTKTFTRCQLMGKLLEDKLYAHQAIQDSIVVTDAEVNEFMNGQIEQLIEIEGSMDKLLQMYNKKSVEEFKSYFFDVVKMNKLTSQMQRKIADGVTITPEEVRQYYKSLKKEELPVFGAEMEVAQIVIKPIIAASEKQKVIDKLKEIKKEVQNGASFFSRAVLFSEDPGSSSNGGFYKINRKTQFLKEFKDVAFSLQEGDISEPFETDYGFHIIYLEKVKGQDLELRHILISPKVTNEALTEAKNKIDSIRKKIVAGEISFAEAARTTSDEKESKNNGGILVNPKTMESRFELTKMDPTLFARINSLKDKDVSTAFLDTDANNNKSYRIYTINNRIEEHTADYALDYPKIKELAYREKQLQEIAKWTQEKIKETYIKISGEYADCTYTNNWNKK